MLRSPTPWFSHPAAQHLKFAQAQPSPAFRVHRHNLLKLLVCCNTCCSQCLQGEWGMRHKENKAWYVCHTVGLMMGCCSVGRSHSTTYVSFVSLLVTFFHVTAKPWELELHFGYGPQKPKARKNNFGCNPHLAELKPKIQLYHTPWACNTHIFKHIW